MASGRATIATNLATLLGTIKIANGYSTNAGQNLHQHPATAMNTLPAYAWRDGDAQVNAGAEIGRFEHELLLEIGAFAEGSTAIAVAREMLADVATALRANPTLTGACLRTMITAHNIVTEHSDKLKAVGTITIKAIYRTAAHTL